MDLFTQLSAANQAPRVEKKVPKNWERATAKARQLHTQQAIDRYRAVMQGRGWLATSQIECALGYAATVSRDFLVKLHTQLGLIEKQPRYGAKVYSRTYGYEWRWKDEQE